MFSFMNQASLILSPLEQFDAASFFNISNTLENVKVYNFSIFEIEYNTLNFFKSEFHYFLKWFFVSYFLIHSYILRKRIYFFSYPRWNMEYLIYLSKSLKTYINAQVFFFLALINFSYCKEVWCHPQDDQPIAAESPNTPSAGDLDRQSRIEDEVQKAIKFASKLDDRISRKGFGNDNSLGLGASTKPRRFTETSVSRDDPRMLSWASKNNTKLSNAEFDKQGANFKEQLEAQIPLHVDIRNRNYTLKHVKEVKGDQNFRNFGPSSGLKKEEESDSPSEYTLWLQQPLPSNEPKEDLEPQTKIETSNIPPSKDGLDFNDITAYFNSFEILVPFFISLMIITILFFYLYFYFIDKNKDKK